MRKEPKKAKTAAERKADERQRRRDSGQVLVQEWVHGDDSERLRKYAAKLRKARGGA
ncbi:MAG: hypothetical protein WC736_14855 [Gallionella sp.]